MRTRRAARDRHDGYVRRFVVVLPALREPARRHAAIRPRAGESLDARRSVHRRRRARDPAPAVLALLHKGAPRRGHGRGDRALRTAVQPGHGQALRPGDVEVRRQRGLARRAGRPTGCGRGSRLRDVHRPPGGGRRVDRRGPQRRRAIPAARVAADRGADIRRGGRNRRGCDGACAQGRADREEGHRRLRRAAVQYRSRVPDGAGERDAGLPAARGDSRRGLGQRGADAFEAPEPRRAAR